ncbi:Hypothetical predicted protein [Paramuricea clavata]|uniref:Uncharacterized protein n=1 Tax=Paramuricea clavata TaxID=317549 RepID=A0A6S7IJI6_PARCT|nr:Hypothetical predicted protein [Paramuricea clavata]
MLDRASSAVGTMICVSEDVEYIAKHLPNPFAQKWYKMSAMVQDLDDKCMKNYAILIGFAEKHKYMRINYKTTFTLHYELYPALRTLTIKFISFMQFICQVIELADVGLDANSAYSLFVDVIIPHGLNKYQTEDANEGSVPISAPESGEPLVINLIIVRCIREYGLTIPKVE